MKPEEPVPGACQGMVDLVGNNPLSPTFGAEDNEGRIHNEMKVV